MHNCIYKHTQNYIQYIHTDMRIHSVFCCRLCLTIQLLCILECGKGEDWQEETQYAPKLCTCVMSDIQTKINGCYSIFLLQPRCERHTRQKYKSRDNEDMESCLILKVVTLLSVILIMNGGLQLSSPAWQFRHISSAGESF